MSLPVPAAAGHGRRVGAPHAACGTQARGPPKISPGTHAEAGRWHYVTRRRASGAPLAATHWLGHARDGLRTAASSTNANASTNHLLRGARRALRPSPCPPSSDDAPAAAMDESRGASTSFPVLETSDGFPCPNCGKVFAREDLLKRHVIREQRAATIPRLPRQKSCNECSRSKARCDLDFPCSRCRKKQKPCVYATNSIGEMRAHAMGAHHARPPPAPASMHSGLPHTPDAPRAAMRGMRPSLRRGAPPGPRAGHHPGHASIDNFALKDSHDYLSEESTADLQPTPPTVSGSASVPNSTPAHGQAPAPGQTETQGPFWADPSAHAVQPHWAATRSPPGPSAAAPYGTRIPPLPQAPTSVPWMYPPRYVPEEGEQTPITRMVNEGLRLSAFPVPTSVSGSALAPAPAPSHAPVPAHASSPPAPAPGPAPVTAPAPVPPPVLPRYAPNSPQQPRESYSQHAVDTPSAFPAAPSAPVPKIGMFTHAPHVLSPPPLPPSVSLGTSADSAPPPSSGRPHPLRKGSSGSRPKLRPIVTGSGSDGSRPLFPPAVATAPTPAPFSARSSALQVPNMLEGVQEWLAEPVLPSPMQRFGPFSALREALGAAFTFTPLPSGIEMNTRASPDSIPLPQEQDPPPVVITSTASPENHATTTPNLTHSLSPHNATAPSAASAPVPTPDASQSSHSQPTQQQPQHPQMLAQAQSPEIRPQPQLQAATSPTGSEGAHPDSSTNPVPTLPPEDLDDPQAQTAAVARHIWQHGIQNSRDLPENLARAAAAQLITYPTLMVLPEPTSPVPPFVFRPWLARIRSALPASLAIARSVLAGYLVRLPASLPTVWMNISRELNVLIRSAPQTAARDDLNLFASTAALWLYLVLALLTEEPSASQYIDDHAVNSGLHALSTLASSLSTRVKDLDEERVRMRASMPMPPSSETGATSPTLPPSGIPAPPGPEMNFEGWGLLESMRRTLFSAYTLLVLQRLRDGVEGLQAALAGAELVLDVGLPADKACFNATSEEDWARNYTLASARHAQALPQLGERTTVHRFPTLRDLLRARGMLGPQGKAPLMDTFTHADEFTNVILAVALGLDWQSM